MTRRCLLALLLAFSATGQSVRPVPPPGMEISAADRKLLEGALARLKGKIAALPSSPFVADVKIFHDAVHYALAYNGFLKEEEVFKARELLAQGEQRADALAKGDAPWARQTGQVVRGYQSKIDDSVQPYGLVVPPNWSPHVPHKWRLDAWFHGRSETLTEVNFLWERQRNAGQFTPADTIVIHLYGRYCNANKFAGEVDLLEAIADVSRKYRIDANRIAVRGFSMGGAATWHIAAHHAGRWAAAAPGAGFAETAEYTGVMRGPGPKPPWYEQRLWRLYDAPGYAANFFNLPLVAYSGELDKQKQAADLMGSYLEKEGIRLTHIIGPKTEHRYHPDAIPEINRRIDSILARGREEYPASLRFATFTLRYNRMKWLIVDALDRHWEQGRVEASVSGAHSLTLKTTNVAALTLEFAAGRSLIAPGEARLVIDGQTVTLPGPESDLSWRPSLIKTGGKWSAGVLAPGELRKRHGLQGPIDDAFMSRFVMVTPTGTSANTALNSWAEAERRRAAKEWRGQFRGEAITKNDSEITDADIASSNLILWGDPQSNQVLARIADKLPVQWTRDAVLLGGQSFPAASHAAILIYPNPLNPAKYVVLNSGMTFREAHYLTNSQQTPKLPDYAIVDLTTPPDARSPGRIALAGFFGERWELLANHGQ
ncbi:MAG: prolyl oligopeptidase family serine peptidase [Bryobacterales bacterium]|nr:prolyl oligopeptidase family serine peptidase [Bryobacterales bacterium]